MARTINAGGTKVSRQDAFFVDPREIIVDPKGNGRWRPLDYDSVVEYAKSFLSDGQQNACLAHGAGGNPHCQRR